MREFLSRYAFFFLILLLDIAIVARRLRGSAKDRREFLDPSLTPDWSPRSMRRWGFAPRVEGDWNGAAASVSMRGGQKGWRIFTTSVGLPVPGKMRVLGRESGFLQRPFVLGGPPRVELMNPLDRDRFLAYASDASLVERILANTRSRSALDGALRRPEDVLTLERGRLSLTIRRADPPLGNSVRELLGALGAVRAALGA
jgi:hypothetical protein